MLLLIFILAYTELFDIKFGFVCPKCGEKYRELTQAKKLR